MHDVTIWIAFLFCIKFSVFLNFFISCHSDLISILFLIIARYFSIQGIFYFKCTFFTENNFSNENRSNSILNFKIQHKKANVLRYS